MDLKKAFNTWKEVFGNWKYLILTIVIAIVFYSLNVLVPNIKNITPLYPTLGFLKTINFFFTLWIGFKSTIIWHSFISLIIISILLGILASLIFYKVSFNNPINNFNNPINKKVGLFSGIGVFLAALVPGCVACGVGLASILGIGAGFLAFLPYEGLELSILSIGLLSFSVLKISSDMHKCDVPLGKTNKDERRYKNE